MIVSPPRAVMQETFVIALMWDIHFHSPNQRHDIRLWSQWWWREERYQNEIQSLMTKKKIVKEVWGSWWWSHRDSEVTRDEDGVDSQLFHFFRGSLWSCLLCVLSNGSRCQRRQRYSVVHCHDDLEMRKRCPLLSLCAFLLLASLHQIWMR